MWQAVRVHCVSVALNKMFLTGSGYAAMAWKLGKEGIPFHSCLVAAMVQELLSVGPWVVLGLYFGAHMAKRFPVILFFFVSLMILLAVYKKKRILNFLRSAYGYCREIRANFIIIIPLAACNVIAYAAYYYLLFRVFSFTAGWVTAVKIASIAFTVGYLSPLPAGIGLKDSSLLFLLAQEGLALKKSFFIAAADRAIVTGLYLSLGFTCAARFLLDALKKGRQGRDDFS